MLRLAIALIVLAGCEMQLVPDIDCGHVPPAQCEAMVQDLLAQAREEYPDKEVDRIRLSTPMGGYDVWFTDGTGFAVTP